MQRKPIVVCGIPCLNSERHIKKVVSIARNYVDKVVVVNDGSQDNTSEVARSAGALVVNHRGNHGAGQATRTCFTEARRFNADILVTIDSDEQHDPYEIPEVLEPVLSGNADIAIGSRFIRGTNNIPAHRKVGISIITLFLNIGSVVKVSDAQDCFRAYGRRALYGLEITEAGFGFSVQTLIEAINKGMTISEVPVSCAYYSDSHSLNPVIHGLQVALAVIRLRLRYQRKAY